MKFKFTHKTTAPKGFRVASLQGLYDLSESNYEQHFEGDIAIEGKPWNIGLIVGSSGSGKSSIAQNLFGKFTEFSWKADSFLEDFDASNDTKHIFDTLSSVGFASPPSWLKRFAVLSNGEKMRVELARAMLSEKTPIVFDEFTSVVDRHIAQVGSFAIQKAIRRANKQFIAVSCHRDITDWLQPDWVYDTDTREFFFIQNPTSIDQPWNLASTRQTAPLGASLASFTI